jgi:DNA polymerase epsilon subunit 1
MKEDLDLPNHLAGVQRCYLQLSFRNTSDLLSVRKVLLPAATRNGEGYKEAAMAQDEPAAKRSEHGALSNIVGLREYDIPYHLRVGIDRDVRVGLWYTVTSYGPTTTLARLTTKDVRPDPVVFAFDIETSKMPLKFPDAAQDHIMMISYMVNGRGFLIVNRDIVSEDIGNFEYTPKPDFPGVFTIFNVADEQALLQKFFSHIQLIRPHVFVTYNGDFFDWPFIETRAASYGMVMESMIGIAKNLQGEYCGSYCVHMDCFCWVKRDSYLPAGSHGLKAVCSIKLGYDPLELDPELMTPLASQDPHTLANYSVSDAVATYYLYMKYVHPFIFSLCNIIPLMPDEVLRKGTGTLCETLLMAEAYKAAVIMPNKYEEAREKFYKGHLLESETYIGGHVEALEAGVFRSDFNYKFKINPDTMYQLVNDLDRALKFFLEHESHTPFADVRNYEEVYEGIKGMLLALAETPTKHDRPLIYHLDVGSMYPNIILTNRLQPSAMVSDATCAVCDFNRPGKQCQRSMTWSWRGEYYSAKQNEYKMIKKQLEGERFPSKHIPNTTVAFHELSQVEQSALIKKRLANYSQKVYRRTRQNEVISKTSVVCQRENSFYIDTVKSFRDRRYDYKNLQKVWKKKLDDASKGKDPTKVEEANKLVVLYDSLQLAHKCILNSFYGYVMRKAARW